MKIDAIFKGDGDGDGDVKCIECLRMVMGMVLILAYEMVVMVMAVNEGYR